MAIKVGDIVRIADSVFKREFAAHYEKYRGVVFEVTDLHNGSYAKLAEVNHGPRWIDGYIHPNDLEKVK